LSHLIHPIRSLKSLKNLLSLSRCWRYQCCLTMRLKKIS